MPRGGEGTGKGRQENTNKAILMRIREFISEKDLPYLLSDYYHRADLKKGLHTVENIREAIRHQVFRHNLVWIPEEEITVTPIEGGYKIEYN